MTENSLEYRIEKLMHDNGTSFCASSLVSMDFSCFIIIVFRRAMQKTLLVFYGCLDSEVQGLIIQE